MQKPLAIIERIIAEHKVIKGRAQALVQTANDAGAIQGLEKATGAFMPGRLDQKQGLQQLEELLKVTEEGLKKHFYLEGTGLLAVFKEYGDGALVSDFEALLQEHKELIRRFAHAKKHVVELMGGELSRHVWEASAHDMRAHISHTRRLLDEHARSEQKLLYTLRRLFKQASRKN